MIPQFNSQGVLPSGIHDCDLKTVRSIFCINMHRIKLVDNLELCFQDMRLKLLQGSVIINGSFVTDKVHPNDIELTLDVRGLSDSEQFRAVKYFNAMHDSAKNQWLVDWYPTIDGNSNFTSFFQYVGVKNRGC